MATAGYTSIGANTAILANLTHNNPVGLKITIPSASNISKTSAALKFITGTRSIVIKIYADSAGTRGSLLFTSNASNVAGTSYAFQDFTFSSSVDVVAGDYWLQAEDTAVGLNESDIAFDTGGAVNSGYVVNDSAVPVYNTNQYSVYATYTITDITPSWSIKMI